jgi:hypothetical protein
MEEKRQIVTGTKCFMDIISFLERRSYWGSGTEGLVGKR